MFSYSFSTVSTTANALTSLSGYVLDPGPDLKPFTADDLGRGPDGQKFTADDVRLLPLQGVKVYVIGEENKVAYTDENGYFELDGIPVGNVKLVIDGRTATNAPAGLYFPEMVMDVDAKVGQVNDAMSAPKSTRSTCRAFDKRSSSR